MTKNIPEKIKEQIDNLLTLPCEKPENTNDLIYILIQNCKIKEAESALEKGVMLADHPNRYDLGYGVSALDQAVKGGHDDLVKKLLDHGAYINSSGFYGTMLQNALEHNHLETFKLLISYGADITRPHRDSRQTVMEMALNRDDGGEQYAQIINPSYTKKSHKKLQLSLSVPFLQIFALPHLRSPHSCLSSLLEQQQWQLTHYGKNGIHDGP